MKKTDAGRLVERRRYIRLSVPIAIAYTLAESGTVQKAVTKNLSADGLRFETTDKRLAESQPIELTLSIPDAANPVHAEGKIVWKKRISLADDAPFDVGVEFLKIEEDNKNTFLKFLCDLIYNLPKPE